MTKKDPLQKNCADLVKEAMKNAGVADLMKLYQGTEPARRENEKLRELFQSPVVVSTSNSSQ